MLCCIAQRRVSACSSLTPGSYSDRLVMQRMLKPSRWVTLIHILWVFTTMLCINRQTSSSYSHRCCCLGHAGKNRNNDKFHFKSSGCVFLPVLDKLSYDLGSKQLRMVWFQFFPVINSLEFSVISSIEKKKMRWMSSSVKVVIIAQNNRAEIAINKFHIASPLLCLWTYKVRSLFIVFWWYYNFTLEP